MTKAKKPKRKHGKSRLEKLLEASISHECKLRQHFDRLRGLELRIILLERK